MKIADVGDVEESGIPELSRVGVELLDDAGAMRALVVDENFSLRFHAPDDS